MTRRWRETRGTRRRLMAPLRRTAATANNVTGRTCKWSKNDPSACSQLKSQYRSIKSIRAALCGGTDAQRGDSAFGVAGGSSRAAAASRSMRSIARSLQNCSWPYCLRIIGQMAGSTVLKMVLVMSKSGMSPLITSPVWSTGAARVSCALRRWSKSRPCGAFCGSIVAVVVVAVAADAFESPIPQRTNNQPQQHLLAS